MAITLRTDEEQDKQIAKLQKKLGFKTSTKLIFHLINNYDDTQDQLNYLREQLQKARSKVNQTNEVVSNFQDSLINLLNHNK